jgi:hypothetical protein
MKKISSGDAQALLKQAAAAIRYLDREVTSLKEKNASFAKDDRIGKIAKAMEEKGLNAELSYEEKVAALQTAKNLDVTEEAIKLAAPQGNLLANPGDDPATEGSVSAFEHFIMTGDEPN